MAGGPLNIAWISDFPVEWLDEAPPEVRRLPRQHPATWMRVLLEGLQDNPRVRLHVIALRKGLCRDLEFNALGATFHVLRTRAGTRAPTLFWTDTLLIRRALRSIQPDLVHAWGTERGAALVGSRLGHPCLVTMQGLLAWYATVLKAGPYQRFAARLEDRALRRARHVTTESDFAVRFLRARHPHLIVHQAEHAPHRIFHQVRRAPQTRPMRFLVTGHLDHRKGSDVLFPALNRLAGEMDFELVHAGTADQRLLHRLRQRCPGEVWRRHQALGALTPAQVAGELARATLLLLPTRADTSPNAVKEAVVAGVPVVATAVGGVPDYVVPGENGLLIPEAGSEELTQALRPACRHPLFSRGLVAPGTLTRMRDYLSPARMAANFLAAYEAVLASARQG